MSLFGGQAAEKRGVVIDIGSGSVGVGIVYSHEDEVHPELIWAHREHMRIADVTDIAEIQKRLSTAIMNTFLMLSNTGVPTLQASERAGKIDTIQVAVSAPWSYTVTKLVSFSDEEPFALNQSLLKQLIKVAQDKIAQEFSENKTIEELGLEVVANTTTDIVANGYNVGIASGQMVEEVSIAHISVVVQRNLMKQIRDAQDKVLPNIDLKTYSFMLLFHCLIRDSHKDTTEVCLIDITREATEMGVVRDGVLKYSTHIPYGSFTLAREIAAALQTTKEEAFSYLKAGNEHLQQNLKPAQQEELHVILTKYQAKVAELFTRTGDTLSIPKTVLLHSEPKVVEFFEHQISNAAKKATDSAHTLHDVTDLLSDELSTSPDAALLLSAHFFHKRQHCGDL